MLHQTSSLPDRGINRCKLFGCPALHDGSSLSSAALRTPVALAPMSRAEFGVTHLRASMTFLVASEM